MKELKRIRGAIQQHFDHLRIEHGLDVRKDVDVYRITITKN
jgi:biotin operon repressor